MTQPMTGLTLVVTLLLVLARVTAAADSLTVTARQTVVRAGPDSKQAILATVPQGTTFALLETRQGWYKILLDDGRGLAVVPAGAAVAPGRAALVIGNAAYSDDLGALKNPSNDATCG